MKISQNFSQQITTPPDAGIIWTRCPDHFWLLIDNGLSLVKEFDGRIRIRINTQMFNGYCFAGSLCNTTKGTVTQITPLMHETINLDPECHYTLIITQTRISSVYKTFSYETRTLDFAPD